MHAYHDGGRLHPALQVMTTGMSESDILNVAAHCASQAPLEHASGPTSIEVSISTGSELAVSYEGCHGDMGEILIELDQVSVEKMDMYFAAQDTVNLK